MQPAPSLVSLAAPRDNETPGAHHPATTVCAERARPVLRLLRATLLPPGRPLSWLTHGPCCHGHVLAAALAIICLQPYYGSDMV